jgi:protocatechuate 3,4-dioxygenase beta subunit
MNARVLATVLLLAVLLAVGIVVFLQGPSGGGGAGPGPATQKPAPEKVEKSGPLTTARRDATGTPSRRESTASRRAVAANHAEDDPVVVRGKVTVPAGKMLDGLQLELYDAAGELLGSGDPESDGTYEIRYHRSLLPGWLVATTWSGIVGPDGKPPAEPGNYSPAFQRFSFAHSPGEPPVECNLSIGVAPTLSGKVTSKVSGEPIENATITILPGLGPWKDYSMSDAETDGEGKYTIQIQDIPGTDILVCCKTDEGQFQATAVGPLDLAPGEHRSIDFQLDAATILTGRVIDESTGRGIADAKVSLTSIDYGFVLGLTFSDEVVKTDENGAFEIESASVPLERAVVHIEANDYAPTQRPPKADQLLEIRLGKPVVVSGRVVDAEKRPVAQTTVTFYRPNEWQWNDISRADFAVTDHDGRFTLTLTTIPADLAVVFIDQEPHAPFLATLGELQLPASTATTREVAIALKAATAAIKDKKPDK